MNDGTCPVPEDLRRATGALHLASLAVGTPGYVDRVPDVDEVDDDVLDGLERAGLLAGTTVRVLARHADGSCEVACTRSTLRVERPTAERIRVIPGDLVAISATLADR